MARRMVLVTMLFASLSPAVLSQTLPCTLPDLYVQDFTYLVNSSPGGWTRMSVFVGNAGTGTYDTFDAKVYLSTNQTIDAFDTQILSLYVNGLSASTITSWTGEFLLPGAVSPGNYFVGARVDPTNLVAECNETNNVLATAAASFKVWPVSSDDHPGLFASVRIPQDRLSDSVTSLAGSIETSGDVDCFRLDVTPGVAYDLYTNGLGTGSDTVLEVYSSDGSVLLAQNDDDPAGGTSGSRVTLRPSSTPLFAAIRHYYSYGKGTYTLRLARVASDDHPGSPLETRNPQDTLSVSVLALSGQIDYDGDDDYFRLELSPGTTYTLATQLSTLADTVLTVVSSDGVTVLASNDDASSTDRSSRVSFTAPDSVLYARVSAYRVGQLGTYTLRLTPPADDHPNAPGQVQYTDTVSMTVPWRAGQLEVGGDEDYFRVSVTAGRAYALEVELDGLSDSVLTLFESNGTTPAGENDDISSNNRASHIDFVATSSTYLARVRGYSSLLTGGYGLRLSEADDHPNSARGTGAADRLTESLSTLQGSIEATADEDYLQLQVTAGVPYVLGTALGTLADSVLTVYGPDGTTPLGDNDDVDDSTRASRVAFTPSGTGAVTLYARVRAYSSTQTGTYSVTLERATLDDHPDRAQDLLAVRDTADESLLGVPGKFDRAGDVDFFQAVLQAGARYRVALSLDRVVGAAVRVQSASGSLLAASLDNASFQDPAVDFTVPGSFGQTTVHFRVTALPDTSIGNYRVRLVSLAGVADDHPATLAATREPEDLLSDSQPANSGTLESWLDLDCFRLALVSGRRYLATVRLDTLAAAEVTILGEGETTLTASSSVVTLPDGASGLQVPFVAPDGRVAGLLVRAPASGRPSGRYSVSLLRTDDHADTAADVSDSDLVPIIGLPAPGTLESPTDGDLFGLELSTGRSYRIEVMPETGRRVRCELFRRDGTTSLGSAVSPTDGAAAGLQGIQPSTSGTHYLRVSVAPGSLPGRYWVRLVLPAPRVTFTSVRRSTDLTCTLTVQGLPGRMTALFGVLLYDTELLTGPQDFLSSNGTAKYGAATPFPGAVLVAAIPEPTTAAQVGVGASEVVVLQMPHRLPAGVSERGRVAAVLTIIKAGNDLFAVFSPDADAGLERVVEAFDAAGRLLPVIQELPPQEDMRAARVRLDGRLSADRDFFPHTLTYSWEVVKAPGEVRLENPSTATPSFVPPVAGEYVFSLVVSDADLASLRAETRVLVNRVGETPTAVPRAAAAGQLTAATPASSLVTLPVSVAQVQLDATRSFSRISSRTSQLTYRWKQVEGPAVDLVPSNTGASPRFAPTTTGLFGFELTAIDPAGSVSPGDRIDVLVVASGQIIPLVSVTAQASSTAGAGEAEDLVDSLAGGLRRTSLRATLPTTVWVTASVTDSEVAAGRHSLRYLYRQLSGPSVQLNPAYDEGSRTVSRTAFSPSLAGVYELEIGRALHARQGRPWTCLHAGVGRAGPGGFTRHPGRPRFGRRGQWSGAPSLHLAAGRGAADSPVKPLQSRDDLRDAAVARHRIARDALRPLRGRRVHPERALSSPSAGRAQGLATRRADPEGRGQPSRSGSGPADTRQAVQSERPDERHGGPVRGHACAGAPGQVQGVLAGRSGGRERLDSRQRGLPGPSRWTGISARDLGRRSLGHRHAQPNGDAGPQSDSPAERSSGRLSGRTATHRDGRHLRDRLRDRQRPYATSGRTAGRLHVAPAGARSGHLGPPRAAVHDCHAAPTVARGRGARWIARSVLPGQRCVTRGRRLLPPAHCPLPTAHCPLTLTTNH
ncbi:MAG: pre-peptidase C-terminal domain-containing protein [Candidatus Riflebacteria bacterium]|nr:pre-peptidase C-terminal domain-containing protein [Candidatus Riflebacteria bacterium]